MNTITVTGAVLRDRSGGKFMVISIKDSLFDDEDEIGKVSDTLERLAEMPVVLWSRQRMYGAPSLRAVTPGPGRIAWEEIELSNRTTTWLSLNDIFGFFK